MRRRREGRRRAFFTGTADSPVRVGASDDTFVYVIDYCGVRRIDPSTGATITITTEQFRAISIAGKKLYTWGNSGGSSVLSTWDLTTNTRVSGFAPYLMYWTYAIAADDSYVWMIHGDGDSRTLYRMNPVTYEYISVAYLPLAGGGSTTALLSVGDYLYANIGSKVEPNGHSNLVRIRKSDGASQLIAGTIASPTSQWIHDITGIASDGTKLYIADSSAAGHWVKTITPTTQRAFPAVLSEPVMQVASVSTVSAPNALSSAKRRRDDR